MPYVTGLIGIVMVDLTRWFARRVLVAFKGMEIYPTACASAALRKAARNLP